MSWRATPHAMPASEEIRVGMSVVVNSHGASARWVIRHVVASRVSATLPRCCEKRAALYYRQRYTPALIRQADICWEQSEAASDNTPGGERPRERLNSFLQSHWVTHWDSLFFILVSGLQYRFQSLSLFGLIGINNIIVRYHGLYIIVI